MKDSILRPFRSRLARLATVGALSLDLSDVEIV
jgi:hypothetical protein